VLWLSITVELVDGAPSSVIWPRPGRVLIVRPDMTFRTLAETIEQAFGRWGPPNSHVFTLADGTRIARDGDAPAPSGQSVLTDTSQHLIRLEYGERFAYEQRPGSGWSHLCTVATEPADPLVVLGDLPDAPTVVDGWGVLPDPNGREWRDDDGATPLADRPSPPLSDLPDLLPWWGSGAQELVRPFGSDPGAAAEDVLHPFDDEEAGPWDDAWDEEGIARLRTAMDQDDLITIVALFSEYDEVDVVHRVGPTLARAAAAGDPNAREALRQVLVLLDQRDWPGDPELADEFREALALGAPTDPSASGTVRADRLALEPTPVDLVTLAAVLDGPADEAFTWQLEVRTGRLIAPAVPGDPEVLMTSEPQRDEAPEPIGDAEAHVAAEAEVEGEVGADPLVDPVLESDDQECIPVVGLGPREQLDDLLAFIDLESATGDAAFLASAPSTLWANIEQDLLRDPEQYRQWSLFAQERRLGRARRWLAARGLRPQAPWETLDDSSDAPDSDGTGTGAS